MQIKPRWIINHAIHGRATIIPSSIRYFRNRKHPYGWELGFQAALELADGSRAKATFSALGTSRNAAMANSLPR